MYSYKNEQQKLDVIKWNESMKTGEDKCGSYSYCSLCKKDEEYPCAKAKRRESNKKGKVKRPCLFVCFNCVTCCQPANG